MSRARPGAGIRVSGGRLRVDAARAIDKLRSYQLADPLGWVLEVVRAGVLMRETEAIAVEGSGGDVFVAIACAKPDPAKLPRLFEELFDPSAAPDARAWRLLAIGVNAALGRKEDGTATRHVDVYALDAEGSERVRFTPQLFSVERETGIAPGLRALTTERAAPPAHAPRPRRGVLVHARAVMGLGALARWAVGEEPRELALVRDATREVRVPLTVGGLPVAQDPAIVMREPLASGGYVALVTPRIGRTHAILEAAEAGVVLSREPWSCGVGAAGANVPVLLRVDRERLPTNAARSAVRWDEPDAAEALSQAGAALTALVQRLAAEIGTAQEPARRSWLRTIAMTLLASEVGGVAFRTRLAIAAVSPALVPLLDARLLIDATGRARSPRELAGASHAQVHYGATYVAKELAPWLGDVLAAPAGDPTHLLFGDHAPASAAPLVELAARTQENERRWLARPVEPPRVQRADGAIARIPLPQQLGQKGRPHFALAGDVVLGAPGEDRTIELRVGGRLLETRRSRAGVGIAVVADCAALTPTTSYDAALDDDVSRAVLEAVERAILAGCTSVARILCGEKTRDGTLSVEPAQVASDPRARALVRHALLASIAADVDDARRHVLGKPLGAAPAWTCIGGTTSIDALAAADAIGLVEKGRPWPEALPAHRPVLVVDDAERTALRLLLPRAHFVDYARVRRPPAKAADLTVQALARGAKLGLATDGDGFARVVAWCDDDGGIVAQHMGVRMGMHGLRSARVPVLALVEDERIVPDEAWSSASVDWIALEQRHALDRASSRIARAALRAWLGSVSDDLVRGIELDAPSVVRAVMLEARAPFEEPLDTDERAALAELRLFPGLGSERTSIAAIRASNEGAIAFVPRDAFAARELDGLALDVLRGSREEALGLAALAGTREVVDATDAIRGTLAARRREARLAAIAARAPEPLEVRGASATARVTGDGIDGVLGFRAHVSRPRVELLVDRRPFVDLEADDLPPHVVSRVSIEPRLVDDTGTKPGEAAVSRTRGAIHASARALLVAMVNENGASLFGDPALRALAEHLVGGGRRRGEVGAMLRALCAPPTLRAVQGQALSIASATVDDELWFLPEPLTLLPPADGEPAGPFDRPIALVPWPTGDGRSALLEKIAGAALRDVTREVRALHTARRRARGLTLPPTLRPGHVAALCRTLDALVTSTDDATVVEQALGHGVIGLVERGPSHVRFFDAGEVVSEISVELVPPFEAAIESPLVAKGASGRPAREEIEPALVRALARLLRRLTDERSFDGAPDWALDAQRDAALLGGRTHLERLGALKLFPTTAGARVSFEEIRTQHERFGPVWWTPMQTRRVPLDPERFSLRLSPPHAAALGRAIPVVDATKELELDQVAMVNRSRPPVASIAPTDEERDMALGIETEREDDGTETVVMVLWPAHASARGLTFFLGMQPLGEIELEGELATRARASSLALTPDRTWSGAVRDEARLAIERGAIELAEEIVLRSLPAPRGPFPTITIDRPFVAGLYVARARAVRGVLSLGPLDETQDAGVRVLDAATDDPENAPPSPLRATAPKHLPEVVPLEGTLVVWGATRGEAEGALDAIARTAYVRLLGMIAARVAKDESPDVDLDRAHLVRGATLGFVHAKELPADVAMPFGVGPLGSLRGVVDVLAKQSAVVVLDPDELDASAEDDALARYPRFVADGSLASQRLALALGPRAITRSDALALALGLKTAARPETARPDASRKPAKTPKAPAGKARESKRPPLRGARPAKSSSGPVEPLAQRTHAVLHRIGREAGVVVQASRQEPLASMIDGALSLAGGSELLAIAAGTAVHRERAAILLAGHVVAQTAPASEQLTALARLLER